MRNVICTLGLCALMAGCSEPLVLQPPEDTSELAVGTSRVVELRFLRLDVENFGRRLTLSDLRQLPRKTLEETWLFDLDARPLVENALARFVFSTAQDAHAQPAPARNLFYLLNMTPENTNLDGSVLAELTAVGAAVGISPSRILADLFQVAPNERIAALDVVTDVVLEHVIATHPRARTRMGPVSEQNPTGVYPVPRGFIAVSLADMATDFGSLAERFGPVNDDATASHPGFLQAASGISLSEQAFAMTVRTSVNALPFQGVDVSHAAKASVNSMGMQIDKAFNFADPNWMTITGLGENLALQKMVMTIHEADEHVAMGKHRQPPPSGDSPVWSEPPWVMESVFAAIGRQLASKIPPHCTTYSPAGLVTPPFQAVNVCIDASGWVDVRVDPSVVLESPPIAGAYLSDLLLDVAQARLHDGGLAEGEANVVMTVHDVPVGMPSADIVQHIRTNLERTPALLRGVAESLSNSTRGDADLFYVQPPGTVDDYLYFVTPDDLRRDENGHPVRPYDYTQPGFFRDRFLESKISSLMDIDGDTSHEKVRIQVGERMYIQDAMGHNYEITVLEKPSARRIRLEVRRIS